MRSRKYTSCLLYVNYFVNIFLAGQRKVFVSAQDFEFCSNNLQLKASTEETSLYGVLCETCKSLLTFKLLNLFHK